MISVEGYDQFDGLHWETGSLRNVLAHHGLRAPHTGEPFTEAMLLGLTGGAGVMYFTFEYEGFAPHVALGTRYPFDAVENVVKRLRLPAAVRQTKSQKKSVDSLLSALVVGEVAIVWADMFTLSYNALPSSPFPAMMPIVVYAYDIDSEMVRIADRAKVPLLATSGELAEARARQANYKNKMMSFEFEDASTFPIKNFAGAVEDAIRACVSLYVDAPPRGPVNNFGLAALERWGNLVANEKSRKGWPQVFAEPEHLYEALKSVYMAIEHRGSGGHAARPLYADFLLEAAEVLDRPTLEQAADHFRAAGEAWHKLALSALPDSVEPFRETRELIDRSQTLFREHGNHAWREMREIADRLEALKADISRSFPLDAAGRTTLLGSLCECIGEVYRAEAEAVRALEEAIA